MPVELSQEQRAAHGRNATEKLANPGFFARLAAHGYQPKTAEEANEYLALGDELYVADEQVKAAAAQNNASQVSLARQQLRKDAAALNIQLPGLEPAAGGAEVLEEDIAKFASELLAVAPDAGQSVAALQGDLLALRTKNQQAA